MNSNQQLTYKEIFKACESFETDILALDKVWLEAQKNIDWGHLNDLSIDTIIDTVIKFLNAWRSRVEKSERVAIGIKETFRQMLPFFQALKDETLEDWDGLKIREMNGEKLKNVEILAKIFQAFDEIGYHFRDVAASKTLHMVLPKLFIMWDTPIAAGYKIKKSPMNYAQKFIPEMKRKANEVIESYMNDNNCSRIRAIERLNSFREPKTLVKLIDEYNYMRYTRKYGLLCQKCGKRLQSDWISCPFCATRL